MIFSSYYFVIEVTHRPHTLFTPLEPPLEGDGFLLSSNTPGDLFQALLDAVCIETLSQWNNFWCWDIMGLSFLKCSTKVPRAFL